MLIQLIHEFPKQACVAFWLSFAVVTLCLANLFDGIESFLKGKKK